MDHIYYRELKNYKYQLMQDFEIQIDIQPQTDLVYPYFALHTNGLLFIKKAYAWDGPSGPSRDTPDFMRASLVHDALYQLMQQKALDYKVHRKRADEILRELCRQDGMSAFRAGYVYWVVRWFGEGYARPMDEFKVIVHRVPR